MNDPTAAETKDTPAAMIEPIRVSTVEQLQTVIRDTRSAMVVGNRTKPPLSSLASATRLISTSDLSGIIEYEPSEFTFTALAGTPVKDICGALEQRNQYLPFDPLLIDSGTTLGGTVGAGLSGPGRHRYGGLRDFILGVEFIDGNGDRIRAGGKVVKNAAGFDIPKLLVGSCGRLGAMTSLTFKVFPRPPEWHTFVCPCDDHQQATERMAAIAQGRWELDAIDYRADARSLWIRVGADAAVSQAIIDDLQRSLGGLTLERATPDRAAEHWNSVRELSFGGPQRSRVIKVPTTLKQVCELARWGDQDAAQVSVHASVAGGLCWVAVAPDALPQLERVLINGNLAGLMVRGECGDTIKPRIGIRHSFEIESAVKSAMDPPGRYPDLLQ